MACPFDFTFSITLSNSFIIDSIDNLFLTNYVLIFLVLGGRVGGWLRQSCASAAGLPDAGLTSTPRVAMTTRTSGPACRILALTQKPCSIKSA